MAIDKFICDYFWLSNFYQKDMKIDNKVYRTVEHYYQSMKTEDEMEQEHIRRSGSPAIAKKIGRYVRLRDNWNIIKDYIMEKALRIKFNDNELKNKLISTGNEELIEGNYWNDTYWGVCNGVGKNKLGVLLMNIRDDIAN